VLNGQRLHRFESGRWTDRRVDALPDKPKHAVVANRRLFLGYDRGDAGELLSIDLDEGSRQKETAGIAHADVERTVWDLKQDPTNVLWAVRGVPSQGEGALYRLDSTGWTLMASSTRGKTRGADRRGGDWNLPGTAFDAISFDGGGRLHLLT